MARLLRDARIQCGFDVQHDRFEGNNFFSRARILRHRTGRNGTSRDTSIHSWNSPDIRIGVDNSTTQTSTHCIGRCRDRCRSPCAALNRRGNLFLNFRGHTHLGVGAFLRRNFLERSFRSPFCGGFLGLKRIGSLSLGVLLGFHSFGLNSYLGLSCRTRELIAQTVKLGNFFFTHPLGAHSTCARKSYRCKPQSKRNNRPDPRQRSRSG